MKMTEELKKLFHEQIKLEYDSAFIYLAMSEWLNQNDWVGAAHWMEIQYREELTHAEGFIRYLTLRNEEVELQQLAQAPKEWDSLLALFQAALAHEEIISEKINKMAEQAEKDGDRAARLFLQWYINEQVEEEMNANDNVMGVERTQGNIAGLLAFDNQKGTRVWASEEVPLFSF
ncbi:MAG: ferritin [Eubacteriales bacterium]|nr:ferritin [Eubacteriales bacterium]